MKMLSIKRKTKSIIVGDFETKLEDRCCPQLRSESLWRAGR